LNDKGEVVGTSYDNSNGNSEATLWIGTTPYNLNNLVNASSLDGYVLAVSIGINNNGQIIADGTNANGATAGFVLTPTPIPAALPLFAGGLGILGLFGVWKRRKTLAA
jgi:hypothetical protein